ncbi:NAD(P)H-dependent oxidoreductase [Dyadobacter sp. CY312]|uniref:NAD(P)H-dependent oxidoreductase n=1 Tax=Dyadobacter sp. CY312 TaxID=2907303 RepID=UPI001F33C3EE|nr:NAD(P)H-dependent oxidoreductase [Dyadobacter sp. CY312]MCE7039602.1 NAD(P)H-dependent oxidoreductase [Dyadobacter sp. CY312]
MKKILVVNGHPDKESFNSVIAHSYTKSASDAGSEVRNIALGELNFNPNLQFGYRQRMELEPDLLNALEDIKWSEHQVWIHPMWWLGMPAIMKGFFDRAFLPGITFKSNKGGISEGLLTGKTGRIITTAGDLHEDVYKDMYKSSGLVQLKQGILEYCGVSSIQNNFIGPLYEFDEHDRQRWIGKVKDFARLDSTHNDRF